MSTGKVLLGVMAGAAAGAVLGILFAPDKGSATRKKIMDMTDDYAGNLKEKITKVINTITEKVGNVSDSAKDLAEEGASGVREVKNTIKNSVDEKVSYQ